jgi:hypothetical protein
VDLAAPPNEVSEARRGGERMLEQEYRSGGCGEAASWQGDVKDSSVTEPADPTQGTAPLTGERIGDEPAVRQRWGTATMSAIPLLGGDRTRRRPGRPAMR